MTLPDTDFNYRKIISEAKEITPGVNETMALFFYTNFQFHVIKAIENLKNKGPEDLLRKFSAEDKFRLAHELYDVYYERRN